jgi:uncharacterized protein (TIGR02186 family)
MNKLLEKILNKKIKLTARFILPLLVIFSLFLSAFLAFNPSKSEARPLIVDSFPRKINIDHNFSGINILVYGARNDAGNVVIVVRGPKDDFILRKKGKIAGIWTNIANIELEDFYSFYAIASMRPLEDINNDSLLKKLEIGQNSISLITDDDEDLSPNQEREYKDAAISMMQLNNLYTSDDYRISFWGETLFRTFIEFPKNIIKGVYNIDIYIFSDGVLHGFQTMPIIVEKVGFEAFMHGFAKERPLIYGLICVFIALSLGWVTATIFNRT